MGRAGAVGCLDTTGTSGRSPESQRKTYIDHCRNGDWALTLIEKSTGRKMSVPYRCRSWRHEGECRRWRAAQNFARVKQALDGVPVERVAYMVVTFDQAHGRHRTAQEAFRGLFKAWPKLRKRLTRIYGHLDYVASVEVHRSGWPHLNLILVGDLGKRCQGYGWRAERQQIIPHLQESGFGGVVWLEPARSRDALAGYAVKLCAEMDGTTGEVVKMSQAPVNAPHGFRRLRASRGFLPPAHRNPDYTGWLVDTRTGLPVRPLGDCQQEALRIGLGTPMIPPGSASPAPLVTARGVLMLRAASLLLGRAPPRRMD